MNINSISVLLGCAGLAIGGIGLLAQEIDRQPADTGDSAERGRTLAAAGRSGERCIQ